MGRLLARFQQHLDRWEVGASKVAVVHSGTLGWSGWCRGGRPRRLLGEPGQVLDQSALMPMLRRTRGVCDGKMEEGWLCGTEAASRGGGKGHCGIRVR